ncbi:MAG: reverse transcriptase family protein [Gemmataceae bacterium]
MATLEELTDLWRTIRQAGGIDAYITNKLRERGFFVERRSGDTMNDREKAEYKRALRLEAEERKKLKQECWEAYRATHLVHLGENVFWNDNLKEDKWDLPGAEERSAENELPQLDSIDHLATALGLTIPELRWLTYHREAATQIHYVRFTIPKSDGSLRAIWAPMPKLKATQRWIHRNIVEKLLVHGSAHGFLAGRSIATNAAVHTNSKLVVKMDIKNFFPTVTFPRVKGIFRHAGYREPVAILLALLCTEPPREIVERDGTKYFVSLGPRCLPQGAPTSPGLTNTLCLRMDQRIHGLAKKLGWRYTRYADDLTFSLPEDHQNDMKVGTLMGGVKMIVSDEGFEIHPNKTRIARKGRRQKITGLIVNGDKKPRVPREVRRQLRAAIHNLKNGKELKEDETLESLIGYAAFVYMTDQERGQQFLDELWKFVPESVA